MRLALRFDRALAHPFVHDGRSSLRHVEGADLALLRKPGQKIAAFKSQAGQALAFVTHDQGDLAMQRSFPDRVVRLFARSCNPITLGLQTLERLGNIGNLGALDMVDGSRRAFVRSRRNMGAALVRDDDARRAYDFRRSSDGAEVSCIGDMVKHHNERIAVVLFSMFLRTAQNLFEAGIRVACLQRA